MHNACDERHVTVLLERTRAIANDHQATRYRKGEKEMFGGGRRERGLKCEGVDESTWIVWGLGLKFEGVDESTWIDFRV